MGGLDGLIDEGVSDVQEYKHYGHHDWNSKLQSMVDELQERFPVEVEVGFIEVSPEMSKHGGLTYKKPEGYFIRISEYIITNHSKEYVRTVVAHEMAHIYMWQIGRGELTEKSPLFSWVLGRVGGTVSGYSDECPEWIEVAQPFLKE